MTVLEPLVAALDAGGVVGVPTDTVYGIACRPDDAAALARVYAVKRRPPEMAVGLLAASAEQLEPLVEMPATARRLAAAFWPGGLSLVLAAVPGGGLAVARPGGTLMVRVPGHPLLRELLRRTGPLAVTSANRHGEPACTTAAEVAERLGGELDALLDGGPGDGRGSTIIDCTEDPPRVLRPGPVSFDQLRPHLGGRPPTAASRAYATGGDDPRPPSLLETPLKPALRAADPEVADLLEAELVRQEETLELIPSENLAPPSVLDAVGSWLTNKYAEGLPGKRYYGGCQVVDQIESLARDRATALFGADHANVQPHCGSSANMAVYSATLKLGDTVLGMALDQGGHLTHGSPANFSGKLYRFEGYTVSESTGRLDYEEVRARAVEVGPKLIVAGYSAYPRVLDFAAFADIAADVGALLLVDMAHFAGLVAAGVHPSPVPHADFVTLTTHKTMRGPWGGMILCRAAHAEAIDKAVFPGVQGGPLNHAIAGKAVMLKLAGEPAFREYAAQVVANARALAAALVARGMTLVTGGTDNHLMLLDLRPTGLKGRAVQSAFDEVGITVNANTFPFHGGSPFNPNGIRLGTPAVTSRGMGETEMEEIADLVATMLGGFDDAGVRQTVRERSLALCRRFPLAYRSAP